MADNQEAVQGAAQGGVPGAAHGAVQMADPLVARKEVLTKRKTSLGDKIVTLLAVYAEMAKSRQKMQLEHAVMDELMARTSAFIDVHKEDLDRACRESVFLDRMMASYQPDVAAIVANWEDH